MDFTTTNISRLWRLKQFYVSLLQICRAFGLDELGPTPTSILPLRKWKGHVYEGGIRVPAIMSWQDKIKPGIISDEYFSTVDYLPTICEIAGIGNIPDDVDGISILPLIKGE